MRRLVNATYMTLDGDIANMQAWHMDYFGKEAEDAASAQMFGADALIMGRETYEGFSAAWPGRSDAGADHMNAIKKHVVSTTLTDPEWNNSEVISENVVETVRALKEQEGENILQYGFGSVTRLLLGAGLVDEVRIWLHPVLSGKATPEERLYADMDKTSFKLNGSEVHSTGMLILSYTPV